MKEIVIISGKGGTGKTSVLASFAILAERAVIADCDVDAADLHLILKPVVGTRHKFYGGYEAIIRQGDCIGCGLCREYCRFDAVKPIVDADGEAKYTIDSLACEGCGVCVHFCSGNAIDFVERQCGEWMISETRGGPMVHARLGVAAENSGKLVALVRREARRLAKEQGRSLLLVDGPPGIGCPVIASVTGATLVLVVTEPTVAGEHDLERVIALTQHFGIPTAVCVNKWDLNPEATERVEQRARTLGASLVGRIRYDQKVTQAQLEERAVVEIESGAGTDIRKVWDALEQISEIDPHTSKRVVGL